MYVPLDPGYNADLMFLCWGSALYGFRDIRAPGSNMYCIRGFCSLGSGIYGFLGLCTLVSRIEGYSDVHLPWDPGYTAVAVSVSLDWGSTGSSGYVPLDPGSKPFPMCIWLGIREIRLSRFLFPLNPGPTASAGCLA